MDGVILDVKLGVSYFGTRNLEHVESDLNRMVEAGCNTVLHTFSENDLRFYLETMCEIVKLSKVKKLEVYIDPWGVGGVFVGESFTQFALENDEARQVLSNGRLAPAACPNNKTFKNFMQKWIDAAIKIGADIIFWDEPHFFMPERYGITNAWACRCESCKNLFYEIYGYDMPEKINQDVESFKDESLFRFIRHMTMISKTKEAKNALCPLVEWENPLIEHKWDKYAQLDSLDIFGTDPYWMLAGRELADFELYVQKVKRLADKYHKEPQIWVQAFRIRAGHEGYVKKSVKMVHQMGIKNIMAWSYLGTAYMSWVRSERPDKVWQALKEAYLEIRGKNA